MNEINPACGAMIWNFLGQQPSFFGTADGPLYRIQEQQISSDQHPRKFSRTVSSSRILRILGELITLI